MSYEPRPYFLAFIDALGFSAHVNRECSKIVDLYLNSTQEAKSTWSSLHGKGPIKFKVIGDSLILSLECAGKIENGILKAGEVQDARQKFWNLCFGIAEIQFQLARNDIWTRGAITYDFLHVAPDSDIILGPAFHRAFKLEQSVARFPRVVVDGGIVSALGFASSGDLTREINKIGVEGNVVLDYEGVGDPFSTFRQDVPTFVDFLNSPKRLPSIYESLSSIASNISKNLKTDLSHYEKYKWLADYLCRHINNSDLRNQQEFERLATLMDKG